MEFLVVFILLVFFALLVPQIKGKLVETAPAAERRCEMPPDSMSRLADILSKIDFLASICPEADEKRFYECLSDSYMWKGTRERTMVDALMIMRPVTAWEAAALSSLPPCRGTVAFIIHALLMLHDGKIARLNPVSKTLESGGTVV